MAVAAGQQHTVIIGEDGSVFACGYGGYGQLGTGDTTEMWLPTRVAGLPPLSGPVRQIAASGWNTGIVTDAGDLLMCGAGRSGQLGLGDEDNRTRPTLVPRAAFGDEAVLMVACASGYTAVVTEGGGVYTFGIREEGPLGHVDEEDDLEPGDEEGHLVPRQVPAVAFRPNGSAEGPGERVVMVAAAFAHMVALSDAGHVFTWGSGNLGKLGHGDEEDQWSPRQVEPAWFALEGQGDQVVFVAAGDDHTVAVTAGGRLYTWGDGEEGQLGHGDTGRRLVPTLVPAFGGSSVVMAACSTHTLVVTQDGGLWACGDNRNGQLGLDDERNRLVFERVGGATGAALHGARVLAAAAGGQHSVAVTEDGALWTWGEAIRGMLGHNDEDVRFVPTLVPQARLDGLRVGRCRVLPEDHAVAFAMGTHGRLGAGSLVRVLAGEVELLRMIAGWCATVLPGMAGRMEGVMRLCGGFHAWRKFTSGA
jgi:alpha-tubulin suppressor-like RCC1 family protein